MIFLLVNPHETPFSWWLHTLLQPSLVVLVQVYIPWAVAAIPTTRTCCQRRCQLRPLVRVLVHQKSEVVTVMAAMARNTSYKY